MQASGVNRRAIATVSIGAGVIGAHAAAYAFFAQHNPYAETIFPPCVILHFTGLQCPGCGGTRAMYSLLHGDVVASLQMNPVVIAGYLAVILAVIGNVLPARHHRASRWLYTSAVAVASTALAWSTIIRNLI